MSLNEQLNNFKKQQVKCQSTLSSIASSRAAHPPSSSSRRPVPAAISQKPLAAAGGPVKFSSDTERLQLINSIRKAPVGAQMKRVIDLLMKTREAFTPEQINEACYVDMLANKAVFDSMRKNPKAHYDGRRFSYKAEHNVKDKKQLLSLINKYPDGIAVIDLKDAYPNVMEDLQALKASEDIWLLSNSQEEIAYPNDFKCDIKVDDDFKALFRDIEVPEDMLEVEKELRKNGLKPATDTAARRAADQKHGVLMTKSKDKKKKKKQEISKRTKLTNAHMPELFQSINASSSRN
ncbi:hypothetical protein EUTSA_v10025896mg [Eutrema salsugineum]|uniref:Transcription initiation factor IIE subunit beta n=1 Tax=Eutrema salsugineum TaxID=72664 RepID=V4MIW3_EUTSA|nr:uncharacterized protein LOC18029238 [Eutrema salsugineum]XP_006413880.1 uncharacterized protein LOC18029238 [Eutrema salsugineum]ESQ55332.1 hypothetical protein EUTSA_v10025896mg [Eutrema salsugineum]ESQ55333.1 hypothetical protein EUTSA_v10025896mg [Eutrema salsugineum]